MFEWRADGVYKEGVSEDLPSEPLENDIPFDEDEEPRHPGRYILSGTSILDQDTGEQRPITGLSGEPVFRAWRSAEDGMHVVINGGGNAGNPSLWKVSPDGTATMVGMYLDGAAMALTEMGADVLDANLELYTLADVAGITTIFIRTTGGSMSLRDVPVLADHNEIDGFPDGLVTGN
jgi:hypothetical protein